MIKICSTVELPESSIEFDEYIAVIVHWSTLASSIPFYYRLCGENGELIEVGLDSETLAICRLGIISISQLDSSAEWFRDAAVLRGLPTFELDPSWADPLYYSDVKVPIRVSFREPDLRISFVARDLQEVSTIVDADPVRFAIDPSSYLVGFSIQLPIGDHYHRLRTIAEGY